MSRIAIVGAGNLGSFLGAHLYASGRDVFFCARRPVEPIAVDSLPRMAIPYYLADPPPASMVLLTVKTYDTPEAMHWIHRLCPNGQPVAVIQNGIHHAARVRPYRAIPVLSYVYVESRDGVFQSFAPPRAHLTVPDGEAEFAALLEDAGLRVHLDPSFHVAAWRKMLHNCVSNPLTAIAGRGLEILCEPLYREWAEAILAEGIPIARADGADLPQSESDRTLETLSAYPAGTRTSMLQDLETGKRLETDALNGMLVELAARYRLPAHVNREIVDRLSILPQNNCRTRDPRVRR